MKNKAFYSKQINKKVKELENFTEVDEIQPSG